MNAKRRPRVGPVGGIGRVAWSLVATGLLAALFAGCADSNRAYLMAVRNYTADSLVVVHQDDGGAETTLEDGSGVSVIRPLGGGRMLEIHDGWCAHGSFIVRTTEGAEVARRTASRTLSTCGAWTIGSPPPPPTPGRSP